MTHQNKSDNPIFKKKNAAFELLTAGKRADKERPEPIFANKVKVLTVLKSAIKSG